MTERIVSEVWAVLLTDPSYLAGFLVVDQMMKAVKSKYPIVAMVTPRLPDEARAVLTKRGIPFRDIEPLLPKAGTHVLDAAHKRFEDTWTKLRSADHCGTSVAFV